MDSSNGYLYWCPKTIEMLYANKTHKPVKDIILTQKQKLDKLIKENEQLKRENEELKRCLTNKKN